MRAAHVLRKYDPAEWGGTETAVLRLIEGLGAHDVASTVFGPWSPGVPARDPLAEAGACVRRFRSFVPVFGISQEKKAQLVRWGGNVMSFDLLWRLGREPFDVIHTHALNRLAGVAMLAARTRGVPFVVTVHGGVLDLPAGVKSQLTEPLRGGIEWGKALGLLVQSRQVLEKADAILTCNPREAELLRARHPHQRIIVQRHSVPAAKFAVDHTQAALDAFPALRGRDALLCVARLDPVKNQRWLVAQLPDILQRHPQAMLVLAGPETSGGHAAEVAADIARLGLQNHVLLTGALDPGGSVLTGLMQLARTVVLPSTSETFGLVILEAWAAGTPMLSSRTSGAASLIRDRESGWLFDLDQPASFHTALDESLRRDESVRRITTHARAHVQSTYDVAAVGAEVKDLYLELAALKRRRCAATLPAERRLAA